MRSPRMSSCAPTGVAIFFLRARCPSRASRAMAATVNPTAVRLAHAPRPKRHPAANPTTTLRSVTLFGVHRMRTCQTRSCVLSVNGNLDANPLSRKTPVFSHLQTASRCLLVPRASQILQLSPFRSPCNFSGFVRLMEEPVVRPGPGNLNPGARATLNYGRITNETFESPYHDAKSQPRMELGCRMFL